MSEKGWELDKARTHIETVRLDLLPASVGSR